MLTCYNIVSSSRQQQSNLILSLFISGIDLLAVFSPNISEGIGVISHIKGYLQYSIDHIEEKMA